MKLLVRNLAKATTEEKLLTLFKEHGSVQSCSLVLDKETGKSKGFAFVEIPKVGEAKAAIKQLNGYKLAGNIIRVKKAETKTEVPEASVTAKKENVVKKKAVKKVVKADNNEEIIEMVDAKAVWGNVKD